MIFEFIAGFPILAQDFVQLSDAGSSILKFAEQNNVDVVVLMGMLVVGDSVRRDLGLINIKNEKLTQQVFYCLKVLNCKVNTFVFIALIDTRSL